MANWCSSTIQIDCVDEKQAENLGSLIERWIAHGDEGQRDATLPHIVRSSGVGTVGTGEPTDLRCSGYITYTDVVGGTVTIDTETAWVPMLRMWDLIIRKYAPGARLFYTAIEPGGGICDTNIQEWAGKYYIDDFDYDTLYDADEAEAIKYLQGRLESKETDIKTLIDEFEDKGMGSAHQWDLTGIDIWD